MPDFEVGDTIRRVAPSAHRSMGTGTLHTIVDINQDGWLRLEIDEQESTGVNFTHGWDPKCFVLVPKIAHSKEDIEALYA